jgi:hypothetical protein
MNKLVAVAALLVGLNAAFAQNFQASIDAAQAGGGARQGTGSGTFTFDGANLSYNVTVSGVTPNINNAHIHVGDVGVQGGTVVFPFAGPFTGTSMSWSGTWTGMSAQNIADLQAGRLYVNVHTSPSFPAGEVRGQIVAVPEPSTYALVAAAGTLGYAIRRRKKV